jgi:hypothetical protein
MKRRKERNTDEFPRHTTHLDMHPEHKQIVGVIYKECKRVANCKQYTSGDDSRYCGRSASMAVRQHARDDAYPVVSGNTTNL